jgi:hypothetical protein
MGHAHKTIVLLTPDVALGREAATQLSAAGFVVVTNGTTDECPDLVLRDWRDGRWLQLGPVPVLTLDLTLVRGIDLVDIVRRVVGQHITRFAVPDPRDLPADAPVGPVPAPFEEMRARALRQPILRFRWRN